MRRPALSTVFAIGAGAGAVLGAMAIVLGAGLLIDGAVQVIDGGVRIVSETLTLYVFVLLAGALGGLAIGYVTAAMARSASPDSPRMRPGLVAAVGFGLGAVLAFVGVRTAIGLGGEIVAEVVTIPTFRLIVGAMVGGALTGGVVAMSAEWLSRPEVLGFEGEAWPQDRRSFMKETLPAMMIPTAAVVGIAVAVFGVSQLLLAGDSVFAIVAASVISVLVLGGGAALAYSGPGPEPDDDEA